MKVLRKNGLMASAIMLLFFTVCVVGSLFVLQENMLPVALKTEPKSRDVVGVSYDFSHLVSLVDEYNHFKKVTRPRFDKKKRVLIDPDYVDELIKSAAHERVSLQNYLWLLEAHCLDKISIHDKQTLLYYMKLTDKIMKDLKKIKNKQPK